MKVRSITMSVAVAAFMSLAVISCKPKDSDLKAKVETSISNPAIMVDVQKGVATLSGEVATDVEKADIQNKAESVKGVSVVNNITVLPPPVPVEVNPDAQLSQAANDAIKDFPGVTANVSGGVVTLTGTASKSDITKIMQAINSASPKQVVNQIVVK